MVLGRRSFTSLPASSRTEAQYGDDSQETAAAEDHGLAAVRVLIVELDVAGVPFADIDVRHWDSLFLLGKFEICSVRFLTTTRCGAVTASKHKLFPRKIENQEI